MTVLFAKVPTPGRISGSHASTSARRTAAATAGKVKKHKAALLELELLLRDPPADFKGTNEQIGKLLGCSARTVTRRLKRLEQNQVILRRAGKFKLGKSYLTSRDILLATNIPEGT